MKEGRWQGRFFLFIMGLFIGAAGGLTLLAMFVHCQTNLYDYEHSKTVVSHTPYLYCAMAVSGVALLAVCFALAKRFLAGTWLYRRADRILFYACGAVIALSGIAWILFYDSVPVSDQRDVYKEALRIAGILQEPFDTGSFTYYARNRGMVLLAAAAFKLSGGQLYAVRLINLAAALLLYGAVCKASAVLWKSRRITALTSVLLMVYYPTVVYVSYLYGTLLSAAFCSLGLCAALLLSETGKVRYGVLMACAFPLGILAHQSAAIGLVAAVLYLLVQGGKREFFRNLVPAALTVLLFLLCSKAVDTVYTDITGADPQADPVPAVCTIYMGITATEGSAGPGSQDGSYVEIFNDNNADGRQASRDALQRIAVVAGEYLTGKRSLSFFLEKVKYQWLDPTFGARKTIVMNDPNVGDPPNSEAFVKFYDSSVRTIAFKLLTGFMLLIYFGSLAGGLRVIRGGRTGLGGMLPALFVLGGIAFQLIWESFSRYCFCYFIWLVPVAACGIDWCCRLLTGDGRQRRETYAARKSAIFH